MEKLSSTKAIKAHISDLKKPEAVATLIDDYEVPVLEKYDPVKLDNSKSEVPTPGIITPDTKSSVVKVPVEFPKVSIRSSLRSKLNFLFFFPNMLFT